MADDAGATGAPRRGRLAQRRKALGLTQESLAYLLGVDRSTVVRWERGETEPGLWIRPKLARALKVSGSRLGELLLDCGGSGGADSRQGGTGTAAVPRQLPAAVAGSVGRAAEIAALTPLDEAGTGAPGTVVISVIGGTAAVGKTALAEFLRALGVGGGQDIPAAEDGRAAQCRSLLTGKKLLIVLDNAGPAEQVRPVRHARPAACPRPRTCRTPSGCPMTPLAPATGGRATITNHTSLSSTAPPPGTMTC